MRQISQATLQGQYGNSQSTSMAITVILYASGPDLFLSISKGDQWAGAGAVEWGSVRLAGAHAEIQCDQIEGLTKRLGLALKVESAQEHLEGLEARLGHAVETKEQALKGLDKAIKAAEAKLTAVTTAVKLAGGKP